RVRVHTKYVPDLAALGLLSAPDVDRAIARSRARIGVDALDLVQFHWWDTSVQRYTGTALRLRELRAAGWIADLGLTNFGTSALQRLVDAGVTPATHQLQYSLLDRRAAGDMTRLCEELGIGLLCYGVLAGGFLSERWIGASEPGVPLENRSLTKYKLIIDEFGGWALFQRLLSLLSRIARGHQVGIGTVAIRWALDQRQVRAVIVGARSSEHLQTIARASTLRLDESDHAAIAEVLADARGPSGDVYELERDRDGPHGRIMRYDLGGSD
ncbi:MAG: aldo/keto reductase, partial [Gemmatimonadota bacterium]